ncbi:helix-turn-helix domain-containing protein [Bifidobacterium catulorum]|uniref:XRE family transcriptional regulator n=1 Tax=Bifidobacterium catulorum TaxID=1630173 RepID=A0A2U2MQF0_9BIFI|nr:helix-turn-helix transcriptional regulator [Bifidobacterium catulorum]PWG59070.1 XRE family transcriptional regulator [Bifidobacterium catulorum]
MTKELGERIRTLMGEYGITQTQLAKRADVSQSMISKYISGVSEPRADTLANIATVLHTTSAELLGQQKPTIATQYGMVLGFCARHGGDLSEEDVSELITTLLESRRKGPDGPIR